MFKKPLLPGLLWTLLIAVLTLMPGHYIPRITTFFDWLSPDKLLHLLLFGIYIFLLLEGFRRQRWSTLFQEHPVTIGLLIGIIFAIFIEVMQKFVIPGRDGNPYDFLADMLGSILGVLIWRITARNEKKKLHSSKKYN